MTSKPTIEAEFGPKFPRRGNAFSRGLGTLLLRLTGWRVVGSPPNTSKMIVAAIPHTSNWDGVLVLTVMLAAGLDVRWVGKHTLFKGMFGRFLVWAGGISVDRSKARDFVGSVVDTFNERESLAMIIAPEGTRKPTKQWKTGFYRIAHDAKVPIVVGYIDYKKKTVGFGPGLNASGDFNDYLEQMRVFLADVTPCNPENFVLPENRS
ncbi:MAG: 1-acyl-sn-glycerol-3-phosphate acyltransferase [Oceanococcus sp.]